MRKSKANAELCPDSGGGEVRQQSDVGGREAVLQHCGPGRGDPESEAQHGPGAGDPQETSSAGSGSDQTFH